jgi:hypothetical protein
MSILAESPRESMMSGRSHATWRLSLDLAEHFGLRPGAIEIRWDNKTSSRGGDRRSWLVSWADGPTVEQMRAAVQKLAGDVLPAELDRGLAFERAITPLAFAMQLIAATQAGEEVGVVDDPVRWEQRLAATEFPERPTDAEQDRLARLLVATGSSRERQVGRVLAAQGLTGLAASASLDSAVVISIRRARDRRGRGAGP